MFIFTIAYLRDQRAHQRLFAHSLMRRAACAQVEKLFLVDFFVIEHFLRSIIQFTVHFQLLERVFAIQIDVFFVHHVKDVNCYRAGERVCCQKSMYERAFCIDKSTHA